MTKGDIKKRVFRIHFFGIFHLFAKYRNRNDSVDQHKARVPIFRPLDFSNFILFLI